MWNWAHFLWICGKRKKGKVLPESSNPFKHELSWIGKVTWAPTGIAEPWLNLQPKALNPCPGAPSQCRHPCYLHQQFVFVLFCDSLGVWAPGVPHSWSRVPSEGLGVLGNLTQPGSPVETPLSNLDLGRSSRARFERCLWNSHLCCWPGAPCHQPDPDTPHTGKKMLHHLTLFSLLCSRQPQGHIPFFSSV